MSQPDGLVPEILLSYRLLSSRGKYAMKSGKFGVTKIK